MTVGRTRGGARAALAHDRARRSRRVRPRDRGDRRGSRREARALRRARANRPARRDPRDEHVGALGDRDRRGRDRRRSGSSGCTSSIPAPLMPLVEIVRAELSSDEAVEAAFAVGERLGKRPIRCHDTPGFVVNRVLIPLLNDCIRVLDEARVSPEDLDTAMTAGAGWPMGPCTLVDLVGIDVHVHASEALYEKLREPRMAPPAAHRRHEERGAARPEVRARLLHVRLTSSALVARAGEDALAAPERPPAGSRRARGRPARARRSRDRLGTPFRMRTPTQARSPSGSSVEARPLANASSRTTNSSTSARSWSTRRNGMRSRAAARGTDVP